MTRGWGQIHEKIWSDLQTIERRPRQSPPDGGIVGAFWVYGIERQGGALGKCEGIINNGKSSLEALPKNIALCIMVTTVK